MPLFIARLRGSKAWLVSRRRPELFRPMFAMWMRSWQSRPAGSLEPDDDVLADAAELSFERFQELREDLLRGWIVCSDGRLYHAALAEIVLDTWAIVQVNKRRGQAGAAARWHRQSSSNAQASVTDANKEKEEKRSKYRAPTRDEQPAPRPAITATCCSCPRRASRSVDGASYCDTHAAEAEAWAKTAQRGANA